MTEGPDERSGESNDSGEETPPAAAAAADVDGGDGRGEVDEEDGDEDGNGDGDRDGDEDGNGKTDTDLAARVERLERAVEELRGTVERQRRDISYLAAAADVESVEAVCPECGDGVLQKSSGLTWTQVSCPECGLKQYL